MRLSIYFLKRGGGGGVKSFVNRSFGSSIQNKNVCVYVCLAGMLVYCVDYVCVCVLASKA